MATIVLEELDFSGTPLGYTPEMVSREREYLRDFISNDAGGSLDKDLKELFMEALDTFKKDFTGSKRAEFSELLMTKHAVNIWSFLDFHRTMAAKILKRGRIANDFEFNVLKNSLDDDEFGKNLENINRMLGKYEANSKPKR